MKNIVIAAAVLFTATSTAIACGASEAGASSAAYSKKTTKAKSDIVDTAVAAGKFKTLVKAVQAAGLVDTLKGDGPFTVFAPTDAAFAKLPKGTLAKLLKDKKALANILTYHVVPGKVTAKQVAKLRTAKTVQGSELPIDSSNGVRVGNANVVKADIHTTNGIVHAIDTVLIPNG